MCSRPSSHAPPPPRGGRTARHELAPLTRSSRSENATRGANSFGAPGGGALEARDDDTPTRCVQRLRSAVAFVARWVMADLSRGRIALPPPGGGVLAMLLAVFISLTPAHAVEPGEMLK